MLIVSQDREEIFNLNNMNSIGIVEKYAGEYSIMGTINTYQSELGNYETIGRAKEILQEIIKTAPFGAVLIISAFCGFRCVSGGLR